jgi:hypothetical protein
MQDFQPHLLDHLYLHIKGRPYDRDEESFSSHEHDKIIIDQNRMYDHKTIQFRLTTYNGHRMEESAKPHAHADIMVQHMKREWVVVQCFCIGTQE